MLEYEFLKYSPNSKVDCPYCGGKKTFTRYVSIDTDTGEYEVLSTDFGYCDRINNCGFKNSPYGKQGKKDSFSRMEIVEVPQQWIQKEVVYSCLKWYDKNDFVNSLEQIFGEEKTTEAVKRYLIGTSKSFYTLYFYIDDKGRTTSAKAMKYNGINRDKNVTAFYPFKVSDGYRACLFGLHLVKKDKDIHIVEAEKTAVIMSIVHDEPYLATGGSNGLTFNKAKDLKDMGFSGTAYLYPDADKAGRDAAIKWKETLERYGIRAEIVDNIPRDTGEDLADLLLESLEKNKI